MSTYRLKNLLAPRSVALVGASPRQGSVGRAILNNIGKAGFAGEFGLVNPRGLIGEWSNSSGPALSRERNRGKMS